GLPFTVFPTALLATTWVTAHLQGGLTAPLAVHPLGQRAARKARCIEHIAVAESHAAGLVVEVANGHVLLPKALRGAQCLLPMPGQPPPTGATNVAIKKEVLLHLAAPRARGRVRVKPLDQPPEEPSVGRLPSRRPPHPE